MLAPGLIDLDLYAPLPDCSAATIQAIQIAVPSSYCHFPRVPHMRKRRREVGWGRLASQANSPQPTSYLRTPLGPGYLLGARMLITPTTCKPPQPPPYLCMAPGPSAFGVLV